MKNISDVLKQKEQEIERLQREIEALRTAMRLCAEPGEVEETRPKFAAVGEAGTRRQFP